QQKHPVMVLYMFQKNNDEKHNCTGDNGERRWHWNITEKVPKEKREATVWKTETASDWHACHMLTLGKKDICRTWFNYIHLEYYITINMIETGTLIIYIAVLHIFL
ncbi:hypothetical protein ACJX0J_012725, partial [Zea mays]